MSACEAVSHWQQAMNSSPGCTSLVSDRNVERFVGLFFHVPVGKHEPNRRFYLCFGELYKKLRFDIFAG